MRHRYHQIGFSRSLAPVRVIHHVASMEETATLGKPSGTLVETEDKNH